MAGHSKWSNIKHRKGAQDAKRAKIFNKLGREIYVAAKLHGDDPEFNPRLRTAISNAKAENMPKDKIKAAIDKATGGLDGEDYEEARYEGYAKGGVAVMIDALTDNRNRTVAEIRAAFTKHDGNLGENGVVEYMFDRVGELKYPVEKASKDDMFEAAVMAGAADCNIEDDFHIVTTDPDEFSDVRDVLEDEFGEAKKSGLAWRPNIMTSVSEEQAASVLALIEALEDLDDVQTVTTNFDVDDEAMERLMAEAS